LAYPPVEASTTIALAYPPVESLDTYICTFHNNKKNSSL
jgi:hypothetical protein